MKRTLFGLCLLSVLQVAAQKSSYKNFAAIQEENTQQALISKAANVVPSLRQIRWQQLVPTAFFHYGINTFTGREWGDGKGDPKRLRHLFFALEQECRRL